MKIRPFIAIILFFIAFLLQREAKASNKYIYRDAEALREYCIKTFGKSDLWYAILKHNGYDDSGEIRKGTAINIPVRTIKDNLKMEEEIKNRLSAVIKAGAEIFAKEEMNNVRASLIHAENHFKEGGFEEAGTVNRQIIKELSIIENICKKAANHKVEAKLYDMHGEVDKQPAGKFSWIGLKKNDNLMEQDKVRTMTKSYADIIFKDESHVFLDENSMILIKKMRENRLNKQNSSTMVLVKGDLQALLNSSKSKNFNIDIPEVETAINSNYFWLQRNQQKDVNISNYDGTIQVASAGKTVNIKENEGVKVKYKKPPSNPVKLLSPPKKLVSAKGFKLSWDKVDGAVQYQIQVALNRTFKKDIVVNKKIKTNQYTVAGLEDGVYFWRVRSFDNLGLPGNYSDESQFVFRNKFSKPYLFVGKQVNKDTLTVKIETQPGNMIYINNQKSKALRQINDFKYPLRKGNNIFNIKVTDKNGQTSQQSLSVSYSPRAEIHFTYPKETESSLVEISGVFDSDYTIELDGKKYQTKNKSFKKIIPLQKGLNLFPVQVTKNNSDNNIYSDTLKIFLK